MLDRVVKKSKTLGELSIEEIDYNTAKEIIIKNHYSKKWNTSFGKINFGVFRNNELLGVAVFGNLMNPNSYKKICEHIKKHQIVELNRMWLDDKLGKNAETMFLSGCFKLLKENYPEILVIQSFADGRLGCGTIYKASNFKYYGYNKSIFFKHKTTGEVFHRVPLENTTRPKGFIVKNRYLLDNELEIFSVKTYRYLYFLNKRAKKWVKKKEKPYPIYEKGIKKVEYKLSKGLAIKLFWFYTLIGDEIYAEKCKHFYSLNDDEIIKYRNEKRVVEFKKFLERNPNWKMRMLK